MLIAPAPDFTERLMWAALDETRNARSWKQGRWMRPSAYDPAGYPITRELIEEGRNWNLMDWEIPLDVPVRILQGGLDEDVPWSYSLELVDKLRSKDVVWTLIKDGDHRLSRPQDIERMIGDRAAACRSGRCLRPEDTPPVLPGRSGISATTQVPPSPVAFETRLHSA